MAHGWDPRLLLISLAAAALLMAAGSLFLALGIRGRRNGDHPHCRRCDFDLFGLGAASVRCPECGADLRTTRAMRPGERRRRPALLVSGAAFLIGGAIALSFAGRAAWRHFDLASNKPVWWLVRDLRSRDQNQRDPARQELARRFRAGRMSDNQLRSIALSPPVMVAASPTTVIRRGTPAPALIPSLASVCIDAAADLRRRGKLIDAEWELVCRRVITSELYVRDPVRHGDPIAFLMQLSWSGIASRDVTSVSCSVLSAMIDDAPTEVSKTRWSQRYIPDWAVQGGGNGEGVVNLKADQWQSLNEGPHRLRILVDANVTINRIRPGKPDETVSWEGPLNVETSFAVVPPDAETVELVSDPSMREVVRRCVSPRATFSNIEILRLGSDDKARTPIDLSFDVILRSGGREVCVGSFATERPFSPHWSLRELPLSWDQARVDVILRPNATEPARHFHMRRIWGEEIVFNDVELSPQ